MDKIKQAENAIRHLKDFIEVEKTYKRTTTSKAIMELENLSNNLLDIALTDIIEIKGE